MTKAAKKPAKKTRNVADMPDVSPVYRKEKMKTVSELIERRKAEREAEDAVLGFIVIAIVIGLSVLVHWNFFA